MLKEDIPKNGLEKEIEIIAETVEDSRSSKSNEELARSVAEQISLPEQKYECIVSDYPILSPHEFHEVQVKSSKYVACFKVCSSLDVQIGNENNTVIKYDLYFRGSQYVR